MPNAKTVNKPGHITTGNVLEDLGFSAEEIREMEVQYSLWVPIRAEIERRKLTQAQFAKVLGIHQPDASLLSRGQISRFSITRLLQFADRLGLSVTFKVAPAAQSKKPRSAAKVPMRASSGRRQSARTAAYRTAGRVAQS